MLTELLLQTGQLIVLQRDQALHGSNLFFELLQTLAELGVHAPLAFSLLHGKAELTTQAADVCFKRGGRFTGLIGSSARALRFALRAYQLELGLVTGRRGWRAFTRSHFLGGRHAGRRCPRDLLAIILPSFSLGAIFA
ncbi:MAG: hypothetical protein AMJ69_04180 [Gammaproteobacteria bacterium SG8_47]|nr:MAG: hypothetical protein AMJ69_04180 [Gammaproteobacteria bacterium SG8_47]